MVTLVLCAQSVIYVPRPNASTRRYHCGSISTGTISSTARAKTSER